MSAGAVYDGPGAVVMLAAISWARMFAPAGLHGVTSWCCAPSMCPKCWRPWHDAPGAGR